MILMTVIIIIISAVTKVIIFKIRTIPLIMIMFSGASSGGKFISGVTERLTVAGDTAPLILSIKRVLLSTLIFDTIIPQCREIFYVNI